MLVTLVLGGLGGGMSLYIISLIASAMEETFEVSRAVIMVALTGHNLVAGFMAPRLSQLMDRLSVRKVLIAGALIAGFGYLIIAVTPSIWLFVGTYALLLPVFTLCFTSLAPAILLSRWFVKHRGTAIGLATLGTQTGGFFLPPLVAMLFELLGWRVAMACLGLTMATLIPLLVYLFVVERPADKGLYPDGVETAPGDAEATIVSHEDLDQLAGHARKSPTFWLLTPILAVLMASFTAVLANLALFALDIGEARETAALMISLYSLVGLCSAVTVGRICDLIDARLVLAGSLVMVLGAMSLYSVANSFMLLAFATGMIAVSGGGFMPLWTSLIGRLFDQQLYSRLFGQVSRVVISVAALSPLLSGWLFDVTGSYRIMFLIFAGLAVCALLSIPFLRPHRATPPMA